MIELLAIPAVIVGAALLPRKRMSDQRKIEIIFENRKISIQKGERVTYPKLVKKYKKDSYTVYLFNLPLGIASEVFETLLPAIREALNKEVEYEFKDLLKLYVFEEELPTKWDYKEDLKRLNTWEVPIGKNHRGILYHDFDKYPHMLVGGVTRFGKTVFLKEVFQTLLLNQKANVEFYILDLKGGLEFCKYEGLPQVKKVASDLYEAVEVLADIVKGLKDEEKVYKAKGFTNIVDTPIKTRRFIIVDEGAELAPEVMNGKDKKYAQFCQSALSEISRIGGGLGLRLIYCTQYPTKQAVPMQVKMNIVTRISFIASATVSSMVILDEPGANELPAIPGRAIYKVEKKRIVQVPYIDDSMMLEINGGTEG
ncbi:FtsK/SpoIIIE domain-containing protein [Peribacillus kribbensis]|uniref:FtsK/SpoIIIE domain-containing protein n=1 Tax=Peribacillus kribbensis TaxID=356658 RepID=UPI000419E594|nr:FtsK/SpoIIIE domain-containing protein [Peribacillus kribbensis]